MNPFLLRKGLSKELDPFPHILEFGARKIQQIRLDSLPVEKTHHFSLYYVWDGRFEWQRGYGAFSYSKSHVARVKRYIENQKERHDAMHGALKKR